MLRTAALAACVSLAASAAFGAPEGGAQDAGKAPEGVVRVAEFDVLTLEAGGPGGLSPAERAELATRRIERALMDPAIGPENLRAQRGGPQPAVLAGDIVVLTVGGEDAARHGSTPLLLAEHWAGLLRERFAEAKARRFSIRLLMRYLVAMTYPIVFLGIAAALRLARRSGLAAVYRASEKGPSPLRLGAVELASRKSLLAFAALSVRAAAAAAMIATAYLFLVATFYHFPATRTVGLRLFTGLWDALRAVVDALAGQVGWVLSSALVLALAYAALRLLENVFDAIESGKLRLAPYITQENVDAVEILGNGLVCLLALSLLILLLPGEGSRLGLGVLACLGLALAVASVGILRQFMAGLSLAFLGSHRFGSRVLWQGREATVLRRRLFHSAVRLRDGRRCLVPNHEILASAVLPAEGSQESLAFELLLDIEGGDGVALLGDVSAWIAGLCDGASVRLTAVEDGSLRAKLLVPALVATDDHFLHAAYAGLRDLAARRQARLVALRPDA